MIKPWPKIRTRSTRSYRVFSVRTDIVLSPRTHREHDFYVIESNDWVNIIPLTSDHRVVMVRQYRHGSGKVTLEIPGGMIENGDSPEKAARRELFEETGYKAEVATLLGVVHPNPAFLTNQCYTFFFENVEKIDGGGEPDEAEDIEVELIPLSKIPELIKNGNITNSLVVTAFWWFFADKIDYSKLF